MFMDLTIVVCTRIENDLHKQQLRTCINSLKKYIKFDETKQIVIVDSDSPDKNYIEEYNTDPYIRIENICNKNYEAGAWFYAYKNYISKRYLFIQDACTLQGPLDDVTDTIIRIWRSHDTWEHALDFQREWVVNWFTNTKWKRVIEPFTMVTGSIFYCQRIVLDDLNLNGFFHRLPTNKRESEAYERYLGAALTIAGYETFIKHPPFLPIQKIYFARQ